MRHHDMLGRTGNAPPDYSHVRALDLPLRPVYVCNTLRGHKISVNTEEQISTHLSEVELRILLVGDTLDLNECGAGGGVALCALVAENASLRVESTE